jgi:hypothetical protein
MCKPSCEIVCSPIYIFKKLFHKPNILLFYNWTPWIQWFLLCTKFNCMIKIFAQTKHVGLSNPIVSIHNRLNKIKPSISNIFWYDFLSLLILHFKNIVPYNSSSLSFLLWLKRRDRKVICSVIYKENACIHTWHIFPNLPEFDKNVHIRKS